MFTDRQIGNPIFYKLETYVDRLLVFEIYIIQKFVKIVKAVLEIVNIYIPTYIYICISLFKIVFLIPFTLSKKSLNILLCV